MIEGLNPLYTIKEFACTAGISPIVGIILSISAIDKVMHIYEPEEVGTLSVVASCLECNMIAHDLVFPDFDTKMLYIHKKIREIYKNILYGIPWEEKELDDIGYNIRVKIDNDNARKENLEARLAWSNRCNPDQSELSELSVSIETLLSDIDLGATKKPTVWQLRRCYVPQDMRMRLSSEEDFSE